VLKVQERTSIRKLVKEKPRERATTGSIADHRGSGKTAIGKTGVKLRDMGGGRDKGEAGKVDLGYGPRGGHRGR